MESDPTSPAKQTAFFLKLNIEKIIREIITITSKSLSAKLTTFSFAYNKAKVTTDE